VTIVRWQVIGEGRTGTIERACAKLASLIWDEKAKKRKDFVEALKDLYNSDKDFIDSFSLQDNLTNQKAVFILKRIEEIERANQTASGKELSPGPDLTLEHILPKSPSKEWKSTIDSDSKIVEECVDRIGNMCLLSGSKNCGADNLDFEKKRKIYAASELLITQAVAKTAKWNRSEIAKRQSWLASKASSIWRLD
jgi:Protein of unknown function (DUF1524)